MFNCGKRHITKIHHLSHFGGGYNYSQDSRQFLGVTDVHIVVQPVSRTLSSCKVDTPSPLNTNSPSPPPAPCPPLLPSVAVTAVGTFRPPRAVLLPSLGPSLFRGAPGSGTAGSCPAMAASNQCLSLPSQASAGRPAVQNLVSAGHPQPFP